MVRWGLLAAVLLGVGSCGPSEAPWPDPPPAARAAIHAEGLLRLGAPAEALTEAEALLAADPHDVWAHRIVQDALIALEREEEARRRYTELFQERPDSAMAAYLAGRVLLPDADEARPRFEDAVELDPDYAWGTIGLAYLEILRGDSFRAIQLQREALDRLPRDADLNMHMGLMCLDLRLLRDAQRSFRAALEERPWDPRCLGGLGQALGQLDQEREAILYLERALERDPSRTDLLGALAWVHHRRGDREAAWDAVVRQQEIDGSADPALVWRLEAELDRSMPHVAILGPYALEGE